MQSNLFFTLLTNPGQVLRDLARTESTLAEPLQRYLFVLLLLPPLCAAIGGIVFGWRLGTAEPLQLDTTASIVVSFLYFLALCFGFFSTVFLARWMGGTYGAQASLESYLALFIVVCAPLSVASIAHLFPHVFFNIIILIPAIIWSMTLLYRGLPIVLQIPTERGMMMSSALVGWLLVAAVSLLGLSAGLWTAGLGPSIRV